jgi:hypothetical protein
MTDWNEYKLKKLAEVQAAPLSYQRRQELPDSAFCYVKTNADGTKVRKFPSHDAAHVRNGLSRVSQASLPSRDKLAIFRCLKEKAEKYGIEVNDDAMATELAGMTRETLVCDDIEASFMETSEKGIYVVKAACVGSGARTADGRTVRWTRAALHSAAPTWSGCPASINHTTPERGTILASEMVDEELIQVIKVDDDLDAAIKENKARISIEAEESVIDEDGNIVGAIGSGTTFVFYPAKPMFPSSAVLATEDGATEREPKQEEKAMTETKKSDEVQATIAAKDEELGSLRATVDGLKAENLTLKASVDELSKFKATVEAEERKNVLATIAQNGVDAEPMKDFPIEALRIFAGAVAKFAEKPASSGAVAATKETAEPKKMSFEDWKGAQPGYTAPNTGRK